MRALAAIMTTILFLSLAGCTSSDEGRFTLRATDAPDNIGDFSSLNVTVETITLTRADNGTEDLEPATETFDLTKLTSGNTTTLFNGTVPVGEYTRLDLHFRNAKGVLVADGSTVDVKAPSGRIFLNTRFTISDDNETSFLFDIQVHKTGNGDYQFKPNADGSGPGKLAKTE